MKNITDYRGPRAADILREYMTCWSQHLSRSTISVRSVYLNSLIEYLGEKSINECRPIDVLRWMEEHPEWASDWTKNSIIRYVQAAFNWAAETAESIERNPFKKLRHHEGLPRRDMTEDEFRAILRTSRGRTRGKRPTPGARFRQILFFIRLTGCRPCEACTLRWDQVDLVRGIVSLDEHKTRRTQRRPTSRVIYLSQEALRLLRWLNARRDGDLVFRTSKGTPWNRHNLAHQIQRARQRAGLSREVKLYGLRHAFGTRAIMRGCDLKTLAMLMGHTTTRMTERYVHLAGQHEHLKNAVDAINRSQLKASAIKEESPTRRKPATH